MTHTTPAGAWEADDSDAYDLADPKHPDYLDRLLDGRD